MAILKHIASKSSSYGAALEYLIFKHAESVKYFREENDGNLPSLKSLKKRKEELTQEIAERKKAYGCF